MPPLYVNNGYLNDLPKALTDQLYKVHLPGLILVWESWIKWSSGEFHICFLLGSHDSKRRHCKVQLFLQTWTINVPFH